MKYMAGLLVPAVWTSSGTEGFFGEGYWFHRYTSLLGNVLHNTMFVAKTTTAYPCVGNMKLAEDHTPAERNPPCIWRAPFRGIALNAVGLSNPGIEELVRDGRWQSRQEPFMLSFMPVLTGSDLRLQEALFFVKTLAPHVGEFYRRGRLLALQYNVSCPNTGHGQTELLAEAGAIIDILRELGIPIIVKICAATPAATLLGLCNQADGVSVSNTVPFDDLPTVFPDIDWKKVFPNGSPLLGRTGANDQKIEVKGGLSGWPLLELTATWVREMRALGYNKHINAGGGILWPSDVDILDKAGADSVSIASVMMLRGWIPFLIPRIIHRANKLFS
jgi:dihydroorotate dehydrogenase